MRKHELAAAWLCGFLSGATVALLLDPNAKRRRKRARDRAMHQLRRAERAVGRRARYEEGQLKGLRHEALERAHLTHHDRPDLEGTLVDKVRSEAFRRRHDALAHINLHAVAGVVHVHGSAKDRAEAEDMLRRVRGVAGVREVVDHLVVASRTPESARE